MLSPSKNHTALVLPGAVAKGAYEAGVVHTLAHQGVAVDRIVATSSGALNGVAYAAGIRSGHEREMTDRLINAWLENGGWQSSMSFNPLDLLKQRGLSDRKGLLKMLQDLIKPCKKSEKREVEFRVIVAPLNGVRGSIGSRPATTFEQVVHFTGKDFDTAEDLARVFDVVTAACAFPGLFAPVEIEGLGPCVDGGTVNNAPIKYALDEGDVNQVYMPVPFPELMKQEGEQKGLGLFTHMIEILINERLYRDLKDAEVINHEVTKLEELVTNGILTPEQLKAVQAVLWNRKVAITEIRPTESLAGTPFSGFFSRDHRQQLIEAGQKAALDVLATHVKSAH